MDIITYAAVWDIPFSVNAAIKCLTGVTSKNHMNAEETTNSFPVIASAREKPCSYSFRKPACHRILPPGIKKHCTKKIKTNTTNGFENFFRNGLSEAENADRSAIKTNSA